MSASSTPPDLSVIVLVSNPDDPINRLSTQFRQSALALALGAEILIVSPVQPPQVEPPVQWISSAGLPYGVALRQAIQQAGGTYLLTWDADAELPVNLLQQLWQNRQSAEVVIASRYLGGGQAQVPPARLVLSKALNLVFSRGLDLRVRDMSSGIRLYAAAPLKTIETESPDFDILQELLVKMLLEGYRIAEVPFTYRPYHPRAAYRRIFQFGLAYLRTFARLWKLRNSIASADYDGRAYNAMMPPQRYWQRQRYRHVTELLQGAGRCLDVGCGSSRIIGALPEGSVGLDILARKLRYARRYQRTLVQGSVLALPTPNAAFACVLCSQVIEHIPRANVLDELDRVLQPGGLLILGTPDYSKWQWRVTERLYQLLLPQAYADEHITHYTYAELYNEFVQRRGYALEAVRYILQGELILALRKPI